MRNIARLISAVAVLGSLGVATSSAAVIWTGPKIVFTKAAWADWTLPENQDRLTDNVWITRNSSQGIYNIKQEAKYVTKLSPAGTEWAYGSAANWASLSFTNWQQLTDSTPPDLIGRDVVLHLVAEDAYLDIKFLSWTAGNGDHGRGGGFSYERATAVPVPSSLSIVLMAGSTALLARSRRHRQS